MQDLASLIEQYPTWRCRILQWSRYKCVLEQFRCWETLSRVVTLSPCMAMIKNINASVGSFMPQMSSSMQDLAGTLNDILGDASITNTGMIQDQPIGSDCMQYYMKHKQLLKEMPKTVYQTPQYIQN